jgi:hypothetical protein
MSTEIFTPEEIVRRGKEIYERDLRARLEPHENGKYLALDIQTGAFEVDFELVKALRRLEAAQSKPQIYVGRIGYSTAIKIGGALSATA